MQLNRSNEFIEQTELPLVEKEEPATIVIERTEEGLDFIINLLEKMRLEGIKDDRPDK